MMEAPPPSYEVAVATAAASGSSRPSSAGSVGSGGGGKRGDPAPPPNSVLIHSEVAATSSSAERRNMDLLQDLYAIIRTTEQVESAYARDAITADEYTVACNRLLSQFKSTEKACMEASPPLITDTASFMRDFDIHCPRAAERLLRAGAPSTVMHAQGTASDSKKDAARVAETVGLFITTVDALRLGQNAVDELQPYLSDLMASLGRVQGLSPTDDAVTKVENWLRRLHDMRAVDQLGEDDIRQCTFDLEQAHAAFMRHLNQG